MADEALFCGHCGNAYEQVTEDTLQNEGQQETQEEDLAQAPNRDSEERDYHPEANKKSIAPLIAGGLVLMMAVAGGSFLACRHFAGNRGSAGFGQGQRICLI